MPHAFACVSTLLPTQSGVTRQAIGTMLHEMGIQTGVDLQRLLETSRAVQALLGRQLDSRTLVSGPVDWKRDT